MICMYFVIAVIMSVFSSPTGSPGCPDLDQTYPISLSDDLREDTLHDLLQRIDMCEGLVSPIHGLARKLNYDDGAPNHL